jgi:phosphoribosyl 1,2-cyclic phosphodiesterase
LQVEIYGVRGSIASPLTSSDIEKKFLKVLESIKPEDLENEETRKAALARQPRANRGTYGGNTTCVILQSQGSHLVIDMGTGLNRFSQECLREGRKFPKENPLYFLITHVHWDHIQAFPFFVPAYIPGNYLEFHSPRPDFKKDLLHQQVSPWCPAHYEFMRAEISFQEFKVTEPKQLGPFTVKSMTLHHPDNNVGFRIEADGGVFVFLSDTEITQLRPDELNPYAEFCKGANVVYADCQYDFMGAWEKTTWGHSNAFSWIDLLSDSDVETLLCSHFDPVTDDELIGRFLETATKYVAIACDGKKIPEIVPAYEGLQIELGKE